MSPSWCAVFLKVMPPGLPWPVYHWASTESTYEESKPPAEVFLKSDSQAFMPRQSNFTEWPLLCMTDLKPAAESWAHCHSSTVFSMPTSASAPPWPPYPVSSDLPPSAPSVLETEVVMPL